MQFIECSYDDGGRAILSTDGTDAGGWQDAYEGRARAYLQQFLQENAVGLHITICGYVVRMNVATGNKVEAIAAEIFQETVIEVLSHAKRFHPEMQPRALFLAIAANILKRHRVTYAKRYRFEVLMGDLVNNQDILDRLMAYTEDAPGPEQALVEQESVQEMLALVSLDDARLLNMVLLQGWDANALASTLGITPGAARVRVHRALSRLREAWRLSEQRKERGKRNG
jgi:RNA polymerase sigma factor (sigma-70 family)